MRPLFRGEGCAVNEGGISMNGNPLARMMDGVTNDPLHAQQMREGFPAPRPMGPMGSRGQMMGPMMGRPGGLEDAWQESGPVGPMGPQGPQLGDAMAEQFMRHMGPGGPGGPGSAEAGFFTAGPMGPGPSDAWAQEFNGGPGMQGLIRPPPSMAARAEMEAAFAQAHAAPAMQHQAAMEAAFAQQQASAQPPPMAMEAAFAQAQQAQNAQMEAAFQQAASADAAHQVEIEQMKAANPEALAGLEQAWAAGADKQELEKMWAEAGPAGAPPAGLEAAWASGDPALKELEELWKSADPEAMAEMADMWRLAAAEGEAGLLESAWAGGEDMEQMWNSGGRNKEYEFAKENPYLEAADPLAEAQRLLREGRDREALLALEAEVQKNPESSEGWRMLGQLYAELDQDIEAIRCLRRGHEVDNYNLDSLLALGVSCTNELDQLPALRYLRMWIENHEEHGSLAQGVQPPPDYEYEAWRQQVTMLFNQCAANNPLDADVFVALGVMENINRNYDGAIKSLATACRLRPNDHTVWNKLGATLANSGKSEQAVVAYHQGLQLKPNYARSWSNLAIAHANLGQHADAARFYLSSLVLNPDASHTWNFLHSAVLNMGNVNAFEAIGKRDLAACTKLIDGVLDPNALPLPKTELPQPPDEILASIGL